MKLHRRPIFPAVIILVLCAPTGRPADAAPLERATRTSSYDGAWVEFPPPSRWLGTMIYDPVRDRLVAFGGFDGSRDPLGHALSTNDVWVLPLAAPGGWTRLGTTETPVPLKVNVAPVRSVPVRVMKVVVPRRPPAGIIEVICGGDGEYT